MADSTGRVVGTAFIGALAAALVAWLTPFFGWLWGVVLALGAHMVRPSGWPNWIAYALALISLQAVAYVAIRWIRSNNDTYQRFVQLTFLGGVWRWRYISGHIHGLTPYCPQCDMLMVYEHVDGPYAGIGDRIRFHCEHCDAVRIDQRGRRSELTDRVEREIDRLLRTGEWRQHVAGSPSK